MQKKPEYGKCNSPFYSRQTEIFFIDEIGLATAELHLQSRQFAAVQIADLRIVQSTELGQT